MERSIKVDERTYQILKKHKEDTGISIKFAIKDLVKKYIEEEK